jgi:hypothetical protein
MAFVVLDLDDWELRGVEQLGVTEHPWLVDPDLGDLWLWKPAADGRLARREHWAEKIAAELAGLLGLPCAQVELASRRGVAGCVSRNVLVHGEDKASGAELLAEIDPTFDPRVRGHPAYTVANVAQVLDGVRAPSAQVDPPLPANAAGFDVMAGYLLFDALVLNRDRHAANWMVARRRDGSGPDVLCPMYDNASSLALSVGNDKMRHRCASGGVAAYAEREGWARAFAQTTE